MERVKFAASRGFYDTLKTRVDEYFERRRIRKADNWQMYLKTGIIAVWVLGSYCLLVFGAGSFWTAIPLVLSLGLSVAGVGFNIQHDGAHEAYSRFKSINWLMGFTMDLVGGSSVFWHRKHNILHHTYTNINGVDEDIFDGSMFRLAPSQPLRKLHRFQHFYVYVLYTFLSIKWMFYDDWKSLFLVKTGRQAAPRVSNLDTLLLVSTKLFHLSYSVIVPLFFHSLWVVILFNLIYHFILGFTLAVVFQMAHAVGEAEFPVPNAGTGVVENEWAIHQVQTTADFARNNPILNWLIGGLNFQIEHHLFPRISHVHYRSISLIVEKTCREFGLKYNLYPGFFAGFVAHYKWLREMGRATPQPA